MAGEPQLQTSNQATGFSGGTLSLRVLSRSLKLDSSSNITFHAALRAGVEVESLTDRIKECNGKIDEIAWSEYPETKLLQQISGMRTLIALMFVLTVEDPHRFREQSGCGLVCRTAAETQRIGRETTPVAHYQGDGYPRICEGTYRFAPIVSL